MFKVKDISKLLGVDRSFLHYYDEIGIIVPQKNDKLYRSYNENDLIALASSKYYRSMDISLKSLSEIILESDLDSKLQIMEHQRNTLLKQAELLKDISVVCDAAIETYKLAYQKEIVENTALSEFEFIPIIHHGCYDEKLVNSEELKKLLDFFPFVAYAYYFPKGSLIDSNKFDYTLGLSIIPYYREKYQYSLPEEIIKCSNMSSIVFSITNNMEDDGLTYDEFEEVRQYANEHHIELTGEAIAYCVFSNYEHDHANIKLVIYLLTK